jgi:hypothetical protein
MEIIKNNAVFVVVFPYISLILGLNLDFTKMKRIIVNRYGVEFIIVNATNNKFDIQKIKNFKIIGVLHLWIFKTPFLFL